jgi:prepilin-type N-terminal cleavage/methylation domain-containing protein/prepilin-type processing-associated H-X9-DG protein
MKRRCFTLVELLVVIGIIAVLMGVLLPALNAVKRAAQKVICGTNLSGLGKAMQLYSSEHGGDYPQAGNRSGSGDPRWGTEGKISDWKSQTGTQWGNPGTDVPVTITSSLFLLIKYEDVTPAQFNCKGDTGIREFKLSDGDKLPNLIVDEITDVWDFGDQTSMTTASGKLWPGQYNSYSYHSPYRNNDSDAYPLGTYSNPGSPACADRNPYLDKNARGVYLEGKNGCPPAGSEAAPSWVDDAYRDQDKTGNAAAHQREGQNVLFVDGHVRFEKTPNCGINKDNIWKFWPTPSTPPTTARDIELGVSPYCNILTNDGTPASAAPGGAEDAFLVSENNK